MSTTELRQKIKDYIDQADDQMLAVIETLMEEAGKDRALSQNHKKILDQRLQYHRENPTDGKDWRQIKKDLKTHYDL